METVREFLFKTDKGGKSVTVGQITDIHINTVNDADMLDEEIANTSVCRKWGAGGAHIPAFYSSLEYCRDFDRVVLTGDILDFYSSAGAAVTAEVFEKYKNIRACVGGHDLTLEMETGNKNQRPLAERYKLLEKFWCNDVHYYSETLEDKVTIVVIDNNTELWMEEKEMFCREQYEKLLLDIESARENGRIILMFMHEAVYSGRKETVKDIHDGRTLALRAVLPKEGTFSRKTYDLITSSSDVIRGVFFGHEHSDFDYEINAGYLENGKYEKQSIPAHCLTSNAYGDGGHIVKITVE